MDLLTAWAGLVEEMRQTPDPLASPALPRLYQLALRYGASVLVRFHNIPVEDREDIVAEVLAEKLRVLVAPATARPLGLFAVALTSRALDHLRAQQVRQRKAVALREVAAARQATAAGEDDRIQGIDTLRALAALSARDHDIVLAVALGEAREDVAHDFGTGRANVDQICSRFRKRLAEELSENTGVWRPERGGHGT